MLSDMDNDADAVEVIVFRARSFPLYAKGVDHYRFEYAVFLLNKDIEQVRFASALVFSAPARLGSHAHTALACFPLSFWMFSNPSS